MYHHHLYINNKKRKKFTIILTTNINKQELIFLIILTYASEFSFILLAVYVSLSTKGIVYIKTYINYIHIIQKNLTNLIILPHIKFDMDF